MNNSNMINPANYYNPFAKYHYVSKTRGVYFPKEAQGVNNVSYKETSNNIYSENYNAETDVTLALKEAQDNSLNDKLLGFLNRIFPENN